MVFVVAVLYGVTGYDNALLFIRHGLAVIGKGVSILVLAFHDARIFVGPMQMLIAGGV